MARSHGSQKSNTRIDIYIITAVLPPPPKVNTHGSHFYFFRKSCDHPKNCQSLLSVLFRVFHKAWRFFGGSKDPSTGLMPSSVPPSLPPSIKRTHSFEKNFPYNITLHFRSQGIGGEKVLFFHYPLLRS